MARGNIPAPRTIPTPIDQNKKTISIGSLIAVLKRTMDNAPTIPSDNTTFEVTAIITRLVIIDIEIKDTPKESEYITP